MKKQKSVVNSTKKRQILMGCAIGGTALIMAGAGIGIGYVIGHKKDGNDGGNDDWPLVIEYNGSFNFPAMSRVETSAPIVKNKSENVLGATFAQFGTLPVGVTFDEETGIIAGTTTDVAASGTVTVTAGVNINGKTILGSTSINWSVESPQWEPFNNMPLNELAVNDIVTEIVLEGASSIASASTLSFTPESTSGNTKIEITTAWIIFYNESTAGTAIYGEGFWLSDTIFNNNSLGIVFNWTQSTRTFDITYSNGPQPIVSTTNWNQVSNGTCSGYHPA